MPASIRTSIALIRSKLFVPGSRPELFPKAVASSADALSFDLEDSVASAQKSEARGAVANYLRSTGGITQTIIVRVNSPRSGLFEADCTALTGCPVDLINIPKVESVEDIDRVLPFLPRDVQILANIETAKGLRLAAKIASAPRVAGLQIGLVDLFAQARIASDDTFARNYVRLTVQLAAIEAGIVAFDSAFPEIQNPDGFRADATAARRLGLTGKSCIHPSQIAIANDVFSPSTQEIAEAEEILAAAASQTAGAFAWKGRMIDKPILERVEALLRRQATKIER